MSQMKRLTSEEMARGFKSADETVRYNLVWTIILAVES